MRRRLPERIQAWVVTGPLGHLYSVVVDLGVYFAKSALTRAQKRLSP